MSEQNQSSADSFQSHITSQILEPEKGSHNHKYLFQNVNKKYDILPAADISLVLDHRDSPLVELNHADHTEQDINTQILLNNL